MSYASGVGGQQAANAPAPSEAQPVTAVNTPEIVADKSQVLDKSVEHGDETALSFSGDLLSRSLGASDTRTAKVSSLQGAIAAGSYTVSSSDIADKVIHSLLE